MTTKPLKKQPKQKRSQDVVEAILEAATRILSEKSLQETSTNRIADTAGVGIGSIYDYFPDKKSIAVALIDKRLGNTLEKLETLLKGSAKSLPELVELSVDFIETHFLKNRIFLREIFLLAPESGRMEALFLHRFRAIEMLQQVLVDDFQKDPEWAQRKAFLLMNSLMGLLDGAIMAEEFPFKIENFKTDLQRMMKSILEIDTKAEPL